MDRSWVDRVADDLAATRAELAGLALLLAGGLVLSVLVVTGAPGTSTGSPAVAPSPAGAVVPTGSPPPPSGDVTTAPSSPSAVVVHVTGAVREPGVVELAAGARLVDAVAAVGGARADAALDALNLAQVVTDGQRLHVPTTAEAAAAAADATTAPLDPGTGLPATGGGEPVAGGATDAPTHTADGLLDLNLATAADLEELPGVGPVLAERILARREEQGPFSEIGQLRDVSGIGEATFQDLAPLVVVP